MELSRTINSDKRYYLDENTIENAASFLQTMRVFNDAKIDLYNALYDQKYLASGPLIDHAYPVFLKEKYKTNDYYNAAVYSAASGSISSQKELKKYYARRPRPAGRANTAPAQGGCGGVWRRDVSFSSAAGARRGAGPLARPAGRAQPSGQGGGRLCVLLARCVTSLGQILCCG